MTRLDLAETARAELITREQQYPLQVRAGKRTADEAGRALAAWRAIVALLRDGQVRVEACLASDPERDPVGGDGSAVKRARDPVGLDGSAIKNARDPVGLDGSAIKNAWPHLLEAIQAAVEHRASKNDARYRPLCEIRTLLIRSASRQGVPLFPVEQRVAA